MFCVKCGNTISQGTRFCSNCGNEVRLRHQSHGYISASSQGHTRKTFVPSSHQNKKKRSIAAAIALFIIAGMFGAWFFVTQDDTVSYADEYVTRAQFARMVVEAFETPTETVEIFDDVPANHPYNSWIADAVHWNIIQPEEYGGSLGADEPITQQEAVLWVMRAMSVSLYVDIFIFIGFGSIIDSTDRITSAIEIGLINTTQDEIFVPAAPLTRIQATTLIIRMSYILEYARYSRERQTPLVPEVPEVPAEPISPTEPEASTEPAGPPADRPGDGTESNPYLLSTPWCLEWLHNSIVADGEFVNNFSANRHFRVIANITAPDNLVIGRSPIPDNFFYAFGGVFDGGGYTITVNINTPDKRDTGLFALIGESATIKNLIVDGNVVGGSDSGGPFIGGLAGNNHGIIANSSFIGNVSGTFAININNLEVGGVLVGGLVGVNRGTIIDSFTVGNVVGHFDVGGLVGANDGTIENSYSASDVIGDPGGQNLGGLVGTNSVSGTISNSYATGNITGRHSHLGGLVGRNNGTISNSYATGNITGHSFIGSLVGINYQGTIINSRAYGNTTGTEWVGGLTGND